MKRYSLIFLLVQAFHTLSFSAVLEVGTTSRLKSIRQAISIAKAGDTIVVLHGTYREKNLIIDKPLVIIGKQYPLLDGQLKYEVVSIKSDDVVFEGFRIENSGYATLDDPGGIKVYDSRNVVIRNNRLKNNFFG